MNVLNLGLRTAFLILALFPGPSLAQAPASARSSDWRDVVQNRLSLYGHRNWIVVADSAFPAYAEPGIETIVVNNDLLSVVRYVASAISSSGHVRATVFLDQELQFIDEHDYPGVLELKEQIAAAFAKNQVSSIPHREVMTKISETGKTFRILFIKTTATIPYTSVYMRLGCGYMTDETDRKIQSAMATAGRQAK
jgi:hypothetical protein